MNVLYEVDDMKEAFFVREIGSSCYSEQISLFANITKDMDGWNFIDLMDKLRDELIKCQDDFCNGIITHKKGSKESKRFKESDGFNSVFARVDYEQHFSTNNNWKDESPYIVNVVVGNIDDIYKEEYKIRNWELYNDGNLITNRETSKFYMFSCTEDCALYEIVICDNN